MEGALELPAHERAAYLDKLCGNDHQLRQLVDALLHAHKKIIASEIIPPRGPSTAPAESDPLHKSDGQGFGPSVKTMAVSPTPLEKPGDQIGRYKLLEQIGEGGFGVVYVAEQREPVKRRVALKIVKLGMDTRQVVARFEAERQALALMDHPNIAKVFDGGTTETGRPYFVMELVRGIKITDYCDQNNSPTIQRLELFIQICRAIQHAHQKGIIHRDIKPSNILVTLHDGVPVPKVIDFGIAKATQQELTQKTVYTQLRQFIGTPAYMSPEQAEMSGLDIDTRSDIYSLGALLYELLTGKTPFDGKKLVEAGLDEIRRIIREEEPSRPSTRISTLTAEEQTTVARRRQVELPKLVSQIRRDLDWIVMKCLEKDRGRRYDTASGLAADVQRYLNTEPVAARPPSKLYRFRKLARRNKLAFGAASAVATALAVGWVGILWQWRQAERNHQEAEANLYAADMNRAAQVLDDLGPVAARGLLERHADQGQLQGFEWRYLWKRCLGDFAYSFPSRSNRVWKLTFSRDGKTLAALEKGGALRLLDMPTRTESVCLTNVSGLAGFTTDPQELILIQREENKASLVRYDPKTRRIAKLFPAESRLGWLPDLLADGRTAVLPGQGTELSLADTRSGEMTDHLNLPFNGFLRWEAFAEACAVSGDGRWVFSLDNGSQEGTVGTLSIREIKSGKILASYRDAAPGTPKTALTDRFYVLRFLPGGRTALWTTRDGFVRRWRWTDPSSAPLTEHGHRGIVWDIDSSADGRRFATAGDDQTVRVWDAEDLRELRILRGHDDRVFTVAFSPDGRWLASGGGGGSIKLWDLDGAGSSGEVPLTIARQLANRIFFTPDGRSVAVGTDDQGISVINTESFQVTGSFKDLRFPARFTPDGIRIIGLGGVGNLATGKVELAIKFPDLYAWTHDVSPDGRFLIVSFRSDNGVDRTEVRDLQRGTVIANFVQHATVVALRFTQDGQTVLASEVGGVLDWWAVNPAGLVPRRAVQVGHFSRAMAISPDGATVALGGVSRISLVDYRTGAIRQRLFGHGHEITGLAFSSDGRTLASCSMDGTIKLWNLHTMQEVCTITFDVKPALGKEIGVQGVGFAPDGNSLWAFSRSGILKYWRAATLDEIAAAGHAHKP